MEFPVKVACLDSPVLRASQAEMACLESLVEMDEWEILDQLDRLGLKEIVVARVHQELPAELDQKARSVNRVLQASRA